MKIKKIFQAGTGLSPTLHSHLIVLTCLILAGCAQSQKVTVKEPVEMLDQEMQVKAWVVINYFIYEDPNFARIVRKHTIMATHDPYIPPNEYIIDRLARGL